MQLPTLWGHLQETDSFLCLAIETARRLTRDSTWQDCAQTTEIDALVYLTDLLKLRQDLLALQRRANTADTASAPREEI